jgi:hypothetical protein
LILGLISLTTFVSFVSIFLPITAYFHLGVLTFLLLYGFLDRIYIWSAIKSLLKESRKVPSLFALGCLCLLAAIVVASGPIGYFDTGLYHAQAVKWINEYGTVPGLGNLHGRLAFNSSWFYFSAFFDIMALDGKTSHLVNALAFSLGLFACFDGFHNLFRGNITLTQVLKCFLALPLCIERVLSIVLLPSLSPDLIVVILLLYLIILAVNYIEQREIATHQQAHDQKETFLLILCISFFLPTIKLSSLPMLLLPLLLLLFRENRTMKTYISSFVLGTIIMLPFILGNIILSGYLLFPFPQLDLFSPDWKIPHQHALKVQKSTKYFAINPTPRLLDFSVADMTTLEWMRFWFRRNGKILTYRWLLLSIIPVVSFAIVCFRRKIKMWSSILALEGLLLLGMAFWFFSAPAYRFGMGWIWTFIVLSWGSLAYLLLIAARPRFVAYLSRGIFSLVCISLLQLFIIRWDTYEIFQRGYHDFLWRLSSLPKAKVRVVKIHEGFFVNVPLKEKAWDADLPSTPFVKYNLQKRGITFKKGFRLLE